MGTDEKGYGYCPQCGATYEEYQVEYTPCCSQCEMEDNSYKRGD